MEQLIEFVTNHWIAVSALAALVVILLVTENLKSGKSLSTHQAINLINDEQALVLDIRPKKEFDQGHVVDAINIPFDALKNRMTELEKYKTKPIIVMCKHGQQSGSVGKTLGEAGYTNVSRLQGGVTEWSTTLPLVKK